MLQNVLSKKIRQSFRVILFWVSDTPWIWTALRSSSRIKRFDNASTTRDEDEDRSWRVGRAERETYRQTDRQRDIERRTNRQIESKAEEKARVLYRRVSQGDDTMAWWRRNHVTVLFIRRSSQYLSDKSCKRQRTTVSPKFKWQSTETYNNITTCSFNYFLII